MSTKRLIDWPEFPLVFTGFFINFFWEMVQSPLYDDVNQKAYGEILISRLHCTVGDVLIILSAYWIVAWAVEDRRWIMSIRLWNILGFTALGLGYTVISEWVNVDIRGAWGYGATMLRVPLLGTGLAPLVQWVVLPPLIAQASRRFMLGSRTRG